MILAYIYLGVYFIALLANIIKFKVIIRYDKTLFITFKLLFLKFTINPIKEEIDLFRLFTPDGFFDELNDLKEILRYIFSKNEHIRFAYNEFIKYLRYKLVYLDILVYTPNAMQTALAHSCIISLSSSLLGYFKSNSKLYLAKDSYVSIAPSFLPCTPHIKLKLYSQISVASLVKFWARLGIRVLRSKREAKNGTKSKRNDENCA